MSIAARRHVAQPQALQAIIVLHVQNIFAVGRDGGLQSLARVRDLGDGEILKWGGPAAAKQGVDAEAPGGEQNQSHHDHGR